MKAKFTAAAFAASLVFSAAVHAEGFFADVGLGQAKADIGSSAGVSVDDTDTTWLIGGGYMFNQYLGVEAGWRDLGKASISSSGTVSGTYYGTAFSATGVLSAEEKADGAYLGVVGELPINDSFGLNAHAGVYFWNTDTTASATGSLTYGGTTYAGSAVASASNNGNDAYYGAGADYKFNRNLGLGVNYTRYKVEDTNIDVWEARLKYNFY